MGKRVIIQIALSFWSLAFLSPFSLNFLLFSMPSSSSVSRCGSRELISQPLLPPILPFAPELQFVER